VGLPQKHGLFARGQWKERMVTLSSRNSTSKAYSGYLIADRTDESPTRIFTSHYLSSYFITEAN
jgi:hypothetical protein